MSQSKIRRYLKHGTLPQLAVFEAVARLKSFTRAAEELYMAQPTVSVQIKKLTETVGLPLFEQVGKGVHLTSVGRELHEACADIFKTLASFDERIANLRGIETGTLHIAASTVAKHFASRALAEFGKNHPGIEVKLHVGHRQSLIERIAGNADDLYLMSNPPGGDDIVTQRILPNPVVVMARADHPLAAQTAVPFARIAREPLLIREAGSGTRMTTEQIFAQHGIKPVIRMELGSSEAIREAMLAGLGITILPRYAMGFELDPQLSVIDAEGFPVESHWHFVYPIGKQLSFAAQTFLDFVRKQAKHLIPEQPAAEIKPGRVEYAESVST